MGIDYRKTNKTGSLSIDAVKTRQLGTGIGQDQAGMLATGGYRMARVADTTPRNQARVAPAASTARPRIPAGYAIPAPDMTAHGVSFDADDRGNEVGGRFSKLVTPKYHPEKA